MFRGHVDEVAEADDRGGMGALPRSAIAIALSVAHGKFPNIIKGTSYILCR